MVPAPCAPKGQRGLPRRRAYLMMCVSVPSVSLLRSPGRCRWLSSSGVRLPGVVSLRPTRRAQRRSSPANVSIPMFRLYTPLRLSGGARLVEPSEAGTNQSPRRSSSEERCGSSWGAFKVVLAGRWGEPLGTVAAVRPTAEIAALQTSQGCHQVAELLRANGIEVVVESRANSALPPMGSYATWVGGVPGFHVFVAKEDEQRARDALRGAFASEWFLRAPDHHPYHSFEAATVEVLRHHVAIHEGHEVDFELREADHLADLMEQNGRHTVQQAFHEGHIRHHERLVEAQSLDEWARACGCAHYHTHHEA
jgi:hypothetical protein